MPINESYTPFENPIEYARLSLEEESFLPPELPLVIVDTSADDEQEEQPVIAVADEAIVPEVAAQESPLAIDMASLSEMPGLPIMELPEADMGDSLPLTTNTTEENVPEFELELPTDVDEEPPVSINEPQMAPQPELAEDLPLPTGGFEGFGPTPLPVQTEFETEAQKFSPLEKKEPRADESLSLPSSPEGKPLEELGMGIPRQPDYSHLETPKENQGHFPTLETRVDQWGRVETAEVNFQLPSEQVGTPAPPENAFASFDSPEVSRSSAGGSAPAPKIPGPTQPDNYELIREQIDRETLFLNFGNE